MTKRELFDTLHGLYPSECWRGIAPEIATRGVVMFERQGKQILRSATFDIDMEVQVFSDDVEELEQMTRDVHEVLSPFNPAISWDYDFPSSLHFASLTFTMPLKL